MFDQLKMMQAMGSLMKNRGQLEEAAKRVSEKLADVRAEGEGGGGAVRAIVNGTMKVLRVELSPALVAGTAVDDNTRELAGGLIAEAVNKAQEAAQAQAREIVRKEAETLGIPGLEAMLEKGGGLGGLLGS